MRYAIRCAHSTALTGPASACPPTLRRPHRTPGHPPSDPELTTQAVAPELRATPGRAPGTVTASRSSRSPDSPRRHRVDPRRVLPWPRAPHRPRTAGRRPLATIAPRRDQRHRRHRMRRRTHSAPPSHSRVRPPLPAYRRTLVHRYYSIRTLRTGTRRSRWERGCWPGLPHLPSLIHEPGPCTNAPELAATTAGLAV